MSDADIPTPLSKAEDWEAIEFPDAMDIEALERSSLESDTPNPPQDSEPKNLADAIAMVNALRQDKRQLQDRVWDLEATLNRMEHGSKPEESASHPTSKTLDRNCAPQPALVETIQTQLETCQHQMARMEREFSLTQQRYNQQTHQLQLSQKNALELRSRLNRQQRYTLQFKAALEKCLEEVRDRDFATDSIDRSAMQMFLDKIQPVEPWSVDITEDEATQTDEITLVAATPEPSEAMSSEPNGLDSHQGETINDGEEEDGDSPDREIIDDRNTLETEAPSELQTDAIASQTTQPSVLPPELTNPKRQPISKLDLPKFPPLN